MKIVIGNLLTQTDVPHIAHGCNCFCTMGAGVAKGIVALYPEAYEADKETERGAFYKLGDYSSAVCKDKTVYNVYTQHGFDPKTVPVEYGSLYNGLLAVAYSVNALGKRKFAIPYLMGCGLAGGDWNKVRAIILEIEKLISDYNIAGDYVNPYFEIICYDIDGLSLTVPKA